MKELQKLKKQQEVYLKKIVEKEKKTLSEMEKGLDSLLPAK